MRVFTLFLSSVVVCFLTLLGVVSTCAGDEPPKTGPATESRFPPLQVPAGFKATLFACDPLIEYPSAISAGPRPGAVFVAVDYMTGLGTEIVRRSEVRLVEDTNGDGYADLARVFADEFNSIMGLAWHDGTLFVMHAPFLTAVRDTAGAGAANERKDLVRGLGLTPEQNPVRLHCANGVTVGHDGWLYLSLGDHGCDVQRPEGDRLLLEGGGILRCRSDGRDLHIFSTGLRNIYDVALDAELNVLVRDNENDGGEYKIRVCHSFFGADHGYPYLYYENPKACLRPLADLGLGSSAGGVCYLERRFPPEFLGNLFFCEWGKSLVRYPLQPDGSSFATPPEIEFAAGAAGDPYGFKPTDVVVQQDGSLMISDYADGQRPKRGRGRIYHVAYAAEPNQESTSSAQDPLCLLGSDSYSERCEAQAAIQREGEQGLNSLRAALAASRINARGRLHAVWILARLSGAKSVEELFAIAQSDPEPSVRAQAIRAIADLVDPILAQHRLDAEPGDSKVAERLAALATGGNRRMLLEIVLAVSRLKWSGIPEWLKENIATIHGDAALEHAAMLALRQSENWPAVLKLLDEPSGDSLRSIALRAASRQYNPQLVARLLARLGRESDIARLAEYAECLAVVHKKPGPWVYWGYRPQPRPANTVAWDRTEAIGAALNRILVHADLQLRLAVLTKMQREKVPASLEALASWLELDTDPQHVAAVLENLRDQPAAQVRRHLELVIRQPGNASANRLAALAIYSKGLEGESASQFLALTAALEDGPVLAEALRLVSRYPALPITELLTRKLDSGSAEVRAAAIQSLGNLRIDAGREVLPRLLADTDPQVRRAAASAAGQLEARHTTDLLLKLAADSDGSVRASSLEALRRLKEPRAVSLAVAALEERQTDRSALHLLQELGGPGHANAIVRLTKHHPSTEVLSRAVQALTDWREKAGSAQQRELDLAVAEIQGTSGSLIRWQVSGPITKPAEGITGIEEDDGRLVLAAPPEGRLIIDSREADKDSWFIARTDIAVSENTDVEVLVVSGGSFELWLNRRAIFLRQQPPSGRGDVERIGARLANGANRLVVALKAADAPQSPVELQVRFRRKSVIAEREQLAAIALARPGNAERGRAMFHNAEKTLCIKCHRVKDVGERIGPELTGLGSRFSRIHIVESILDPSRNIAPSFGTTVIVLNSGQTISGIKTAESETALTLVDSQGQKHVIAKEDIGEQQTSSTSTMPDGLEKRVTPDEFVDLVAFLVGLVE